MTLCVLIVIEYALQNDELENHENSMSQENHLEDLNEFREYGKTHRLFREVVLTEKIDGSQGIVAVIPDGTVRAGSRNRWITPEADNFGFAAWVKAHEEELRGLGVGRHFGEWWGSGIQRGYGCATGEHHWSLFNVARWDEDRFKDNEDARIAREQEKILTAKRRNVASPESPLERAPFVAPPDCCEVVPVLYVGPLDTRVVTNIVRDLNIDGSHAKEGFRFPEGIIVYHTHAGIPFKVTCHGDGHKYAGGVYPGVTQE